MALTKLNLAGNNLIIFPARESLVTGDIPAGDGKIANLYLQCTRLLFVWGLGFILSPLATARQKGEKLSLQSRKYNS
jgi:hypothetical protein